MARKIKAKRRFFMRQPFGLGPIAHGDKRQTARVLVVAEKRYLRERCLGAFGFAERNADRCEQRGTADIDRVECTGPDQPFHDAPVHRAFIDAAAEVEQVLEETAAFARIDDDSMACSPVPLMPPRP